MASRYISAGKKTQRKQFANLSGLVHLERTRLVAGPYLKSPGGVGHTLDPPLIPDQADAHNKVKLTQWEDHSLCVLPCKKVTAPVGHKKFARGSQRFCQTANLRHLRHRQKVPLDRLCLDLHPKKRSQTRGTAPGGTARGSRGHGTQLGTGPQQGTAGGTERIWSQQSVSHN